MEIELYYRRFPLIAVKVDESITKKLNKAFGDYEGAIKYFLNLIYITKSGNEEILEKVGVERFVMCIMFHFVFTTYARYEKFYLSNKKTKTSWEITSIINNDYKYWSVLHGQIIPLYIFQNEIAKIFNLETLKDEVLFDILCQYIKEKLKEDGGKYLRLIIIFSSILREKLI